MNSSTTILKNERGSVLVFAIMVLALVTIIAFAAVRTSNIEKQIAVNELLHQTYLISAESGISRAIKQLEQPFVAANAPLVRAGTATASWDFVLTGLTDNGDGLGSYEEAVVWIPLETINGVNYQVRIWNNDDTAAGGSFDNDEDGLIWMHARSWGARGGESEVQILLFGDTTGESVTGYTAQAGAGAGKNYNANDLNPITDFSRQL